MVGPISGSHNKYLRIVGILALVAMFACASTPSPDDGAVSEASDVPRQELSGVDVEREADQTVITLEGLSNPAWTASMSPDGDALVIELTNVMQVSTSLFAAMSATSNQVDVYDGLVDQVTTSTFDGEGDPVTRVEVTLATPADYEVVQSGSGLTLWLSPGAEVAVEEVAEYGTDEFGDTASTSDDYAAMDEGLSEDSMEVSPVADDPWAEADPLATDAALEEELAEAEEGLALDDEPAPMMEMAAMEPPPTATTLLAVATEATDDGLLVHLQANGMISSAESFTLQDPDRLVIDLLDMKNAVPQNKIALGTGQVERVRIGSHPNKLRIVLDGGASSNGFEGRRVVPSSDGLYLTVGTGTDLVDALNAGLTLSNSAGQLASSPSAPPAPAASISDMESASEPLAAASEEPAGWGEPVAVADDSVAEIYGLQYDRNAERDRVAVLSNQVIEYEVMKPDSETVVISIKNAVVSDAAGERITPELGGPISLVTTFQQPDVPGHEVRVVMKRGVGVEPQLSNRGSLLFVDFPNIGVAAAPPPAFIPGERVQVASTDHGDSLTLSESTDEQMSMTMDGSDPMSDTALAATDQEVHTALPEFDESAPIETMGGEEDWATAPMNDSAPASLEPPAAVEMLEEGGLIDGKEYRGRRISLDFKDVEIADVLRLIAEVSDLNVIAGDEVRGNITIRLVDVPWDQALDVILLTKGLGFVRVGNVLRIAPSEILKVEEEVRLQERRNKEKLEDLEVKLQPVNYASVNDVAELIRRLLSPRGTVNTDERTNTLIIKDISSVIDEATALIQAVDTQTPQVMIEAKIVEAGLEFARELGSTWAVGTQKWEDGFNPGTPRTDLGGENFRFQGENSVVFANPITAVPTGLVNFGAFLLDDKMRVDVQIQAMEKTGDGKVISSPRVVTLDNREAMIEQGVSIPFQTFEGGDAKLEFIDAVLSLKVTPHITTDQSIIMQLEVTRNAPDSSVSTPTGSPAIAKNQAKTETLVKDGQTLVIGGIYTIDKSVRDTRVPYLHRIPVLGAAFKSKEVSDQRKELLIFVTPRVVVNPALAAN
jgi:type IV pilus assembly protein PilQ